ncbi:MAG: response regulator [Defluviitaleaceae bacterium]|nr:response regulator [Defluviitaleaceae bacterium]
MGKKSILIAADNPESMGFLIDLLKNDYDLHATADGHNTITVAMNLLPQLILLDLDGPGMTGYEVVSALRFMNETRNIPAVIISGNTKKNWLQLDATDYVPKNPDSIKTKVQELIGV